MPPEILSLVIGTLLSGAGYLLKNAAFGRVEELQQRVNKLEEETSRKFEEADRRSQDTLEAVETRLVKRFDELIVELRGIRDTNIQQSQILSAVSARYQLLYEQLAKLPPTR